METAAACQGCLANQAVEEIAESPVLSSSMAIVALRLSRRVRSVRANSGYRPDVSNDEASTTRNILNVLARADGYGPFNDFSALSEALPAACWGGVVALRQDGSIAIFAATATRLYLMDNTTFEWTAISKGGTVYSNIPSEDQWGIKQFGNLVIG